MLTLVDEVEIEAEFDTAVAVQGVRSSDKIKR